MSEVDTPTPNKRALHLMIGNPLEYIHEDKNTPYITEIRPIESCVMHIVEARCILDLAFREATLRVYRVTFIN